MGTAPCDSLSNDVFIFPDTKRLACLANILDEADEPFRIVLLTCRPERYRGLPNAKFFQLEKNRGGLIVIRH